MTIRFSQFIKSMVCLTGMLCTFTSFADEQGMQHAVFNMENGNSLATRMSVTDGKTRAGLLQYRTQEGEYSYGVGYRQQVGDTQFGTLLHQSGLLIAVEKAHRQFNMNLDTHEPVTNNRTPYVRFSVVSYW